MPATKPCCPRCRSEHLSATISFTGEMGFEVKSGELLQFEHDALIKVKPVAWLVCKKCGHGWESRGRWWIPASPLPVGREFLFTMFGADADPTGECPDGYSRWKAAHY